MRQIFVHILQPENGTVVKYNINVYNRCVLYKKTILSQQIER